MKQRLLLSAILVAFVFSACNSTPKTKAGADETTVKTEKTEKKVDCLIGVFGYTENNFEMTFTFNEDRTGKEVYSAEDVRPFTWSYKDGNPVIVYDGETNEWPFVLDCENKELTIMGVKYKKK